MRWPTFRFQQDNLAERSAIPVTYDREYCGVNLLYGAAEVLRQFAGLPPGHPIPWAVQHLIAFCPEKNLNPERSLLAMRQSDMAFLFTITDQESQFLIGLGHTRCVPIGSVFLYARELYRRRGLDNDQTPRRGTIVFPDKSDMLRGVEYNRQRFAQMLARLPEEYQPVHVCMFWRDYDRGNHEPYARAGLPLVCAGHSNDAEFYLRHYDLCRNFKYACSNEISTSFCLSVLAGCRFIYLSAGPVTVMLNDETKTYEREPSLDRFSCKQECLAASPFPPLADDGGLQRSLAARFAGEHHMRTPEFFQSLWEPACAALSDLLPTTTFQMDAQPTPAQFGGWLPYGFDADGWGDSRCGLEVPAREGFAGVDLELHFPELEGVGERMLTVRLDGDEAHISRLKVQPGSLRLPIPLRTDGTRRKVELTCLTDVQLPGEPRRRAMRLAEIEWKIAARWQPCADQFHGCEPRQN